MSPRRKDLFDKAPDFEIEGENEGEPGTGTKPNKPWQMPEVPSVEVEIPPELGGDDEGQKRVGVKDWIHKVKRKLFKRAN
jgi:hypothetical protein